MLPAVWSRRQTCSCANDKGAGISRAWRFGSDTAAAADASPPRLCISSSLCFASERRAVFKSKIPILLSNRGTRRFKLHRQSGEAPKSQIIPPDQRTRLQLETRQTANHGLKCFLPFHPRQRRTEAEMSSVSKGEVAVIDAGNIKTVGIREALRIAVRRRHHGHDRLSLADHFALPLHIFRSQTSGVLAGTLVTQHFFDGGWNQRLIFLHSFDFTGIAQ